MSEIIRAFHQHVRAYPDKFALLFEQQQFTYRQLAQGVLDFESHLRNCGFGCGDHIVVLLPNCPQFVILMLAAAKLGIVLIPLNTSFPAEAIERAYARSDGTGLISPAYLRDEHAGVHGLLRAHVAQWHILEEFPDVGPLVYPARHAWSSWSESLLSGPDAPFIITMTSGSTGDPKPILLTQHTKFLRAQAAIALYRLSQDDVVLAATPLYHSLAERLVLMPLLIGATSVLLARYTVDQWIDTVVSRGVTFSIAVSAQASQLAQRLKEEGKIDQSRLRCLVSSSAAISAEAKEILTESLGAELHECYGASEVAIVTDLDCQKATAKLASVGRAIEGVELRILREDGSYAPVGEVGEIICRSPYVFSGYYGLEDATQRAFHDGYFRTGDIGQLDEDGFLYFLDRAKDVVITGGINVYPQDVEQVISEFESVRECAVFPLPHAALGEMVAAAIVADDPERFDRRGLRIHCANKLADFQQPLKVFLTDVLPRSELGKVQKHRLVKQFTELL